MVLSLSLQPYQARLQQFRSKVGTDEPTKISHSYFVDPDADVVTTMAPEFQNMEYENGITTVKGTPKNNSISKDKTVDFVSFRLPSCFFCFVIRRFVYN